MVAVIVLMLVGVALSVLIRRLQADLLRSQQHGRVEYGMIRTNVERFSEKIMRPLQKPARTAQRCLRGTTRTWPGWMRLGSRMRSRLAR